MIEGFEKQTHELTDYKLTIILPKIVSRMKTKVGRKSAVTNSHVVKIFKKHGYKLTQPRFRKIIQHIRINGLIENLVSSSSGYYIATKKEEVLKYVSSLDKRINSITLMRDQLKYQSDKIIDNDVCEDPF